MLVASVGVVAGSSVADAAEPRQASAALSTVTESGLPFKSPVDLAVDEEHGHVFVSGFEPGPQGGVAATGGGLAVRNLDGTAVTRIGDEPMLDLELDAATDSLYVGHPHAISVWDTVSLTERARYQLGDDVCAGDFVVVTGKLWFGRSCGVDNVLLYSVDLATDEITSFPGPNFLTADIATPVPGQPGLLLMANSFSSFGDISAVDVTSGSPQVLRSAAIGTYVSALEVTPNGEYVLTKGHRLRVSDLVEVGTYPSMYFERVVAAGATSVAVGASYVYAEPDVLVHTAGRTTAKREFELGRTVSRLAWSADESRLYALAEAPDATTHYLTVITDATHQVTDLALALPFTAPDRLRPGPAIQVSGRLSFVPGKVVNGNYDGQIRALQVTRTDRSGTHTLPAVSTDATGAYAFSDTTAPLGRVSYSVSFAGDSVAAPASATATGLREVPWDINGDGFAEVVVGAPGEDIGSDTTTGLFHVLYGRSTSLTGTGSVAISQDTPGVPGAGEDGDQFGFAQASGDFNADGFADVAVSANLEDIGAAKDGGAVTVFFGSASGLRTDNAQILTIASAGFPEADEARFGESLAAGDFNGDGWDELAIGADGIGKVFVAQRVNNATTTLAFSGFPAPFSMHGDDAFGFTLSAGDINGDGMSDLAAGAPGDYLDLQFTTGAVQVLYGSITGLQNAGNQRITAETPGVPGAASEWFDDLPDFFGWQVALADFSGDGKADLAITSPGAPVTSGGSNREDAGTVTILYSDGSKIGTAGAVLVSQDTGSMPGAPRKGDLLGLTMAAGDASGDGISELAVYSGDAYVAVIPGATGGLDFAKAKGWTQNSTGVPGTSETGDEWGACLRFVSALGTGKPAGLLVGAPGENSGAGAITFLPGAAGTGLTGTGSQYFSQNSTGIPGSSESGDVFGSFY
jgi:hypothetical protein